MDYLIAQAKLRRWAQSEGHEKIRLKMAEPVWKTSDETPPREMEAHAFRFERGTAYLYDVRPGYRGSRRAVCRVTFVPAGERPEQQKYPYASMHSVLADAMGGSREEMLGVVRFRVDVGADKSNTRLRATFTAFTGERSYYNGSHAYWRSESPEALAMGRAYVYEELPSQAVLDWLNEKAPTKAQAEFARLAMLSLRPVAGCLYYAQDRKAEGHLLEWPEVYLCGEAEEASRWVAHAPCPSNRFLADRPVPEEDGEYLALLSGRAVVVVLARRGGMRLGRVAWLNDEEGLAHARSPGDWR